MVKKKPDYEIVIKSGTYPFWIFKRCNSSRIIAQSDLYTRKWRAKAAAERFAKLLKYPVLLVD